MKNGCFKSLIGLSVFAVLICFPLGAFAMYAIGAARAVDNYRRSQTATLNKSIRAGKMVATEKMLDPETQLEPIRECEKILTE